MDSQEKQDRANAIYKRLRLVLAEMESQKHLAASFPAEQLSFNEEMAQIKEFINVGEAGPAYEVIVATLEQVPFAILGSAAVALLELGLLFRYKTDRPEDRWLQE